MAPAWCGPSQSAAADHLQLITSSRGPLRQLQGPAARARWRCLLLLRRTRTRTTRCPCARRPTCCSYQSRPRAAAEKATSCCNGRSWRATHWVGGLAAAASLYICCSARCQSAGILGAAGRPRPAVVPLSCAHIRRPPSHDGCCRAAAADLKDAKSSPPACIHHRGTHRPCASTLCRPAAVCELEAFHHIQVAG
jgi:hypothetical protein